MSLLGRLRDWIDSAPAADRDADGDRNAAPDSDPLGDPERPAPDGGATHADVPADADLDPNVDADASAGVALGGGADADADGDGRAVDDLEHRIDEVEERLDRQSASVRGVESAQTDLADRVDAMDDRTRRLLGVYDRLTDDVNPPTDAGPADGDAGGSADDEFRFGAVGEPDDADAAHRNADRDADDAGVATASPSRDESSADGVVTIDDLGSADADADGADAPPAPPASAPPAGDGRSAAAGLAVEADVGGYAADLVIFEWLTALIDAAGPAGALRAVGRYERTGWIGPDLRAYLETVLGGPALDADVDPREPGELTVTDHERSHRYVRRLAVLGRIEGDAEAAADREGGR